MKIAIIEIDNPNHHSLIFNWVTLCNINGWDLTLYTTKPIYDNVYVSIQNLSHNVVLKSEDESNFTFLRQIQKFLRIDSFDFVILLTLQTHILELILFNPKNIKIGITIHNAKTWFSGNRIRKPSHILKRIFRKIWLKRASFYIVNSPNMKNYIDQKYKIKKGIFTMPFLLKRSKTKQVGNNFKVVCPGMISAVRKKYDSFIELAKSFKNIEFVLLGAPNKNEGGFDVIENIKINNLDNIRYFESFVDAKIFNQEMQTATILFSELNINYKNSDFDEIYGTSKDSGVSYLMYEYSIPGIFNNGFVNLSYLSSGTFYFNSNEQLIKIMNTLLNVQTYKEITKSLRTQICEVSIENISKDFAKFI